MVFLDDDNYEKRTRFWSDTVFGVFLFLAVFTFRDVAAGTVQRAHATSPTSWSDMDQTLYHFHIIELFFYTLIVIFLGLIFYHQRTHW